MAEAVRLTVIGQCAGRRRPGPARLRPAPELAAAAQTVLRREPDQSRATDVDRRLAFGVGSASGRARRLRLQFTDGERRRRWPWRIVRVAMVSACRRAGRQRSGNRETRRTRSGGGQGGKAHRRTSSSKGRRPLDQGRPSDYWRRARYIEPVKPGESDRRRGSGAVLRVAVDQRHGRLGDPDLVDGRARGGNLHEARCGQHDLLGVGDEVGEQVGGHAPTLWGYSRVAKTYRTVTSRGSPLT